MKVKVIVRDVQNSFLKNNLENMKGLLGDEVDYIVKHEKIMINVFDEFTGRWYYNVKPEQLFWNENVGTKSYKCIDIVFDNPFFYALKLDKLKRTLSGWAYEDEMLNYGRHGEETINVRFENVEYSYQILESLEEYWGGWNCNPKSETVAEVERNGLRKEMLEYLMNKETFTLWWD